MRIKLERILVSDLDSALASCINVLGFVKERDGPMGDTRCLAVVGPEEPDGTEPLLEPDGERSASKAFKQALHGEGIPLTVFLVDET